MEKVIFRQANQSDLPIILDVTERAYKFPFEEGGLVTKPHESEGVGDEFLRKEFFAIVAEIDSKIVGSVRYKFLPGEELHLFNLAVLKEYRQKNIGSGLVGEVEKVAEDNNYAKITLDCAQEKGLPEYYELLGFKIDEIKKHHDHHDVYMSKLV